MWLDLFPKVCILKSRGVCWVYPGNLSAYTKPIETCKFIYTKKELHLGLWTAGWEGQHWLEIYIVGLNSHISLYPHYSHPFRLCITGIFTVSFPLPLFLIQSPSWEKTEIKKINQMPTREKNQCSARAGCRKGMATIQKQRWISQSKKKAERTSWVKGNTWTENANVTLSQGPSRWTLVLN